MLPNATCRYEKGDLMVHVLKRLPFWHMLDLRLQGLIHFYLYPTEAWTGKPMHRFNIKQNISFVSFRCTLF